MYTDPIADMLTRIRNAQMVNKSEVILPYSKLKFSILKLLEKEGWIGKVEVLDSNSVDSGQEKYQASKFIKRIRALILYDGKKSKISSIKRVSKPGCRVYVNKDEIPVILNGYGIAIISTSRGLMTNHQAKKEAIGGEVICEIY